MDLDKCQYCDYGSMGGPWCRECLWGNPARDEKDLSDRFQIAEINVFGSAEFEQWLADGNDPWGFSHA